MSRVSTFLNTIGDIAKVLYDFSMPMLKLVLVGVQFFLSVDLLCRNKIITTDRTYVLMATIATVIVTSASAFCHVVSDALFEAKMATALRTAMKVDNIATAQDAAELVDYWRNQCSFASSHCLKASAAFTGLKSKNETLQSENEKLLKKNQDLQNNLNLFCFILISVRYMSPGTTTTPASAVVAPAGAQV